MFSQNQEAAQEVLSEDEQKELDSSIIPYGGHATIHQGNISFSGNLTVTVPTPAQTPVPVNINVGHTNTHNTILTRRAVEAQEQYRLKQEQDAAEKKAKEFTAKLLHLKTSLPAHYQRYHQLERLFDEGKTSIVDSFINLALIKETEHKQKEKRLDRGANLVEEKDENVKEFIDERMASHEELYAVKEPLALNQLFEPKDDTKTPNKILILGRAGIGKSVLCQYLAVQWAAGLECKDEEQRQSEIGHYFRQKFDAVFWVKLREMADFLSHPDIDKPTARKNLLGYVIHKFCFRLDKKLSPEEIETYIESNKGKALFILDGYDEITEQVRQSHYLDNFLDRMKHQPYLLMTSRPVAIEALKINFDRKLENIGFTNENIEAYVRHFMNDVEKSDQAEPLLKFLKTHPSIWGIAHVPINLELLSWLWSQGDLVLAQGKAMTLSKLYQTIVDRVQGECAKKFNPLQASQREESKEEEPSSTDIVNEFLEYLAYAAMQQESLLIPKNQLKDALIKTFRKHRKPNNQREQERVLKSATDQFGFLRATGQGGRSLLDQPHYFIHLSFQEFYAARYITRVLSERGPGESEEKAHVIQHIIAEKYMPRYQLMLWMTAGLLYQQGVEQGRNFSALEQFWKAILSEPRDLIGFHQMVLVMHCLDECEADDHLPVHNMLINQQRQWVNFYIRHYYYGKYKYTDELARCPLLHSSKLMIDHMLKNLKDEDKNVRCAAVSALGKLQDPRGEVANALLTALKDENEDVRGAAVSALGKLQNPTGEVVNALVTAFKDENKYVRRVAVSALGKLQDPRGEVANALLTALKDENEDVRGAAVSALGKLQNPTGEVVNALVTAFKGENKYVRRAAVDALGQRQNPSGEVVNAFLAALKEKHWEVRRAAVLALGKLQDPSSEVVNALVTALKDEDKDVRRAAVSALGQLQNPNAEMINALVTAFKDEDWEVRHAAVFVFGKLQNPSGEAINALMTVFKDENKEVRCAAVDALDTLQDPSGEVINALLTAFKDEDKDVRHAAVYTLGKFQNLNAEAVNVLVTASKDEDRDVRRAAISAFVKLQDPSGEGVNALLTALKDKDKNVRYAAISALGRLQNPSGEVVNALLTAFKDEDKDVKRAVVDALGKLQNPRGEVVNALLTAFKDENEDVRSAAVDALGALQNPNAEALNVLVIAFKNEDKNVRRAAVSALANCKKIDALRIIFKELLYYPSFNNYLSHYFQKNHLLCIDYKEKQLILSLDNKTHKISLLPEALDYLEKQIKAVAKQEGYPLDILYPVAVQRRPSPPTLFGKNSHPAPAEKTPKQEVQTPEKNYCAIL